MKNMTSNLTIWPFISHAIVLFGVIVATCAIFYNVRTAKKQRPQNFYSKAARIKITRNRYTFLKK